MINLLAPDFADFLATWYGKLIFVAVDVLIVLLIVAVLYRYGVKALFDFVIGLVLCVVTCPVWITVVVLSKVHIVKTKEYKRVFKKTYYAGKKGKRFALYSFTTRREDGSFTSLGETLEKTGIYKLPYLFSLVTLRTSLVGIKAITVIDEKFVAEEDYDRFLVRPGFCSPLLFGGKKKDLTYEEMFEREIEYEKKYGFFRDVAILFLAVVHTIRGDKKGLLGEAEKEEYAPILLSRGEISQEEYDDAVKAEKEFLIEEALNAGEIIIEEEVRDYSARFRGLEDVHSENTEEKEEEDK